MGNIIIVFILCIFSIKAAFSSCENINFYTDVPGVLELPIENQGNMNTCYAHTLASVYNMEFASSENDKLAPYWVAFIHKDRFIHWNPKNLNYSLISWAWKDIKKAGRCDPTIFQLELVKFKNGIPYSNDQLFFLLQNYFQAKFFRGVIKDKNFNKTVDRLMKKFAKEENEFYRPWSRAEIVQVLNPLRGITARKRFFNFLERYTFQGCDNNRESLQDHSFVSFGMGFEKNHELAPKVEGILAQGKPVALGFCPKAVYKDRIKDIDGLPRLGRAINLNCGSHYVSLVGSRSKADNKCEYLMRNSYGEGFWPEKDGVTCWCENRSTGDQRDCTRTQFNAAQMRVLGCWFDSDKILSNSFDLSYFKY